MYQVSAQLAHMPVHLICLSNGLIAFTPTQQFSTIWQSEDGYQVCIGNDGISFTGESLASPLDILYNSAIEWRDKEVLVKWLKSMNLQQPSFY